MTTAGVPTSATREPPSSTTLFLAFGGLMASLAAGYGVLFTIVDDYRDEYGISETAIGVVIGIGFIAGFLAQVLIAPLADRGHARKVVLFGVGVNVVGLLLMGFSTTLTPILIGRFVSGIGIGAAVPAARRIVILADPDHLGQNLGRLISADVFGFALGPAVSAILVGPFGIPAPFIVVAVSTVVLMALRRQGARAGEHRCTEAATRARPAEHQTVRRCRRVRGRVVRDDRIVRRTVGGRAPRPRHQRMDRQSRHHPLRAPADLPRPIRGRLAQVHGPFRISVLGLSIGAFFMASYGLLPTGTWIFAFAMLHAVGDGITVSSSGVAVGMVVPQDRQAGAQGVLGAAQALAAGIMAVVTAALVRQLRALDGVPGLRRRDARADRRRRMDGEGSVVVEATAARAGRPPRRHQRKPPHLCVSNIAEFGDWSLIQSSNPVGSVDIDQTRGMAELLTLDRRSDGVALITLSNGKVNALSTGLLGEIRACAVELTAEPPGAVVITGGDRLFAAGADISEFGGPDEAATIGAAFHDALDAVAAIPRFVIAAVSGYALGGGCELALACDYRIASDQGGVRPARDPARDRPGRRGHAAAPPDRRREPRQGTVSHRTPGACG